MKLNILVQDKTKKRTIEYLVKGLDKHFPVQNDQKSVEMI